MHNSDERQIKVCLLGDQSVGKSCLARRFVQNVFTEVEPTVGASYTARQINVDKKNYKIQIWDTAGQENYRNLAPMYYRGAAASLLVFDITKEKTFLSLNGWLSELREMASSDMLVIIVGNKLDLEDQREVTALEVERFVSDNGLKYFESSAKTGENTEEIFTYACRHIPEKLIKVTKPPEHIRLEDNILEFEKKKPKCC